MDEIIEPLTIRLGNGFALTLPASHNTILDLEVTIKYKKYDDFSSVNCKLTYPSEFKRT